MPGSIPDEASEGVTRPISEGDSGESQLMGAEGARKNFPNLSGKRIESDILYILSINTDFYFLQKSLLGRLLFFYFWRVHCYGQIFRHAVQLGVYGKQLCS